jgi:hypothetical protein
MEDKIINIPTIKQLYKKLSSMEFVLVDISNEMRLINRKLDEVIIKVNQNENKTKSKS